LISFALLAAIFQAIPDYFALVAEKQGFVSIATDHRRSAMMNFVNVIVEKVFAAKVFTRVLFRCKLRNL